MTNNSLVSYKIVQKTPLANHGVFYGLGINRVARFYMSSNTDSAKRINNASFVHFPYRFGVWFNKFPY